MVVQAAPSLTLTGVQWEPEAMMPLQAFHAHNRIISVSVR